jgi:hypothetical protein
MKLTKLMSIGTLLLLGVGASTAQSLGNYAREVRKNKTETSSASHHYDNDNLPTGADLSVVGPEPTSDNKADPGGQMPKTAAVAKTTVVDPNAAAAERQKASEDLKRKIDKQKEKIDWLSHDLDLEQREYRLRAAAFYGDAGDRLRNSAKWDKDEAQYKSDIDSKQKAIEAARQEFTELQEQARKAGIQERDNDNTNRNSNSNSKDNGEDTSKNENQGKDKEKDK